MAGIVTSSPEKARWAMSVANLTEDQVFSDYREAISTIKPDLFLIVAPPHTHREYALYALSHGVPVICEKPIADTEENAKAMLEASERFGVPLAIAENYRYFGVIRRAHELVSAGAIGPLCTVRFDFLLHHEIQNYHTQLRHPLLLDISVHHFDTIRFVTGLEACSIDITTWDPAWSIYQSNSCATAELSLENGVHASYCASLCSYRTSTKWTGDWRIEGEKGMIEIKGNTITLSTEKGSVSEQIPENENSILSMLDAIADDFSKGHIAENDIRNNMKSYLLAMRAIESADTGSRVFL